MARCRPAVGPTCGLYAGHDRHPGSRKLSEQLPVLLEVTVAEVLGRRTDFHIASATVRPNPSAMLFWATTVVCRWSALTDVGLRRVQVRMEEVPRPLRPLVRSVRADMRAPHDAGARGRERRAQASRLGIVHERDVPGPDEREHLLGVPSHDALVVAPLG